MILLPALIGGTFAAASLAVLWRIGVLHRFGFVGLVLLIIAGFWPLFAVAAQDDGQLLLHAALFAPFGAAVYFSYRIGIAGLALVIFAHGILDAVLFATAHPGPLWWPAFCAAYDVVFGAGLLASLRWVRAA